MAGADCVAAPCANWAGPSEALDHFRALYPPGRRSRSSSTPPGTRWLAYLFPGNVRELKNIVIRLTTKYGGYTVGEAELEPEFAPVGDGARPDPLAQARADLTSGRPFSLDATLKSLEQAYLDAAIEIAQGNMSQAAKLLGISRGTLYGRLESAAAGAKINHGGKIRCTEPRCARSFQLTRTTILILGDKRGATRRRSLRRHAGREVK